MATELDTLLIKIAADTASLRGEMQKANQAVARSLVTMQREAAKTNAAFEQMGAKLKSVLVGALGAFSVAKLVSAAKETLRWADDTKTLADRLGTSAESIQELIFAGREMNITAQEMTKGLSEFAVKVAEAGAGKGRGVVAFQALGISLREVGGRVKNLDVLLDEFANKIRQFDRPSQLALAKSFFGEEGALKFLDLLGQGKGKIDELRKAARDAGVVLGNDLVARGEQLNKEVERLTDKVNAGLRKAFLDLGPVIEGSLNVLLSIFRDTRAFVAWLEGKAAQPGVLGRGGAIQPGLSPEGFKRTMKRQGAVFIDENLEGQPLHDETQGSRADQARRERGGLPGTRTVDLSGKGASQLETFRKLMEDLRAETEKARAALDPFRAAIADLDAKLAKMNASAPQRRQATEEFTKAWGDKGVKALKEFGAETEQLQKITAAEAAGRKDLVAILELEFALRQKFGEAFVAQNKQQIEDLAKLRLATEQLRERQKAALDALEGLFDSFASHAGTALDSILDKSATVSEALRNFFIAALRDIANEMFKLAALNPLKNLLFGGNRATIGDVGGLVGSIFGGSAGGGFDIVGGAGIGFASGGSFRVPGGGGTDSTPIGFMATPGERVTVETPGQVTRGMGGGASVTLVGSDAATIEIGQLKTALRQMNIRVTQLDRSVESRAIGANIDARRRGGQAANF